MRLDAPSSAELAPLLAGPVTWEPVVTSWLGGLYLGSVPVVGGSVTWSKRSEVQGSLDLTVPREHGGRDWRPGNDHGHPLARFGQTLHVSVRVTTPVTHHSWLVRLGTFLLMSTSPGPGVVRVTGASMMQRLVDDRLTSPMPSRTTGTLSSELRRLVPASIGVRVEGLTDRTCPAMSWGESRVDAVQEIVRAWPARLLEDAYGVLRVRPPLAEVPTPVDTLTDGEGGTLVGAYEEDTREGTYNRVVARGQESDDAGRPTIQAIADITSGPMRTDGPYGVVTAFFASPLLTSTSTALAAAQTRLADLSRPARTVPVTLAPDPRWEVDDAVAVEGDGERWWGYVSGVQIPLTVGDGDMRMDVEVA